MKPEEAIIRLPPTTMERKRAYLRAAAGQSLADWIFQTCDRASDYKTRVEQLRQRVESLKESRERLESSIIAGTAVTMTPDEAIEYLEACTFVRHPQAKYIADVIRAQQSRIAELESA
jgi:hypothetical protein